MGFWAKAKEQVYGKTEKFAENRRVKKEKGEAEKQMKLKSKINRAQAIKETETETLRMVGKERALKGQIAKGRQIQRMHKMEGFAERHPGLGKSAGYAKTAAEKSLRFAGGLARTGAGTYGIVRTRLEEAGSKGRGKAPMRARTTRGSYMPQQGSFVSQGQETSMSAQIGANQWYGERNVMTTEFFGQKEDRDLLGNQRERVQMDFFGTAKKNGNGIAKTNGVAPAPSPPVDYLGDGSKNKKKPVRYF